ncbi:membrane protein [Nocardioides psychrotolerans]|uniref:Probable cobalt transporter subunit (CbtA) n=1 Tax=Nocardioides psychrotolerans TaxID=1005945 RepID=A0A1I3RJG4_9ACTN|nr:CbtA family protein [Nocardioides psychrotolerans]GEP40512.1 membrane protein [Nocardioides psychrotolerans]SFJ45306.1 Probable cobalt transporter subunit (CbtA) [Nocardioides psychrotolerans]
MARSETLTTRTFLLHGLLAGLVAGLLGFAVASAVGEPSLASAIALEDEHSHSHSLSDGDEETAAVSRDTQSTWGLATGTIAIGVALGGLVALGAAGAMGRLGRLRPGQSTALVTAVGFVAVALVPFLKYPALPPGVGSGDSIGERTASYAVFLLVSVVAAALAVALAALLTPARGVYVATLAGAGGYLVVVVLAAAVLPATQQLGAFPADTLWSFRLGSLATLAAVWLGIGVVLTGLVGRASASTSTSTRLARA